MSDDVVFTPGNRPRVVITASATDRVLEALSIAGVLAFWLYLATVWGHLPERLPTHFGLSGAPDGWGSRNTLFFFALFPAVVHVAFGLLARIPWTYNYPVPVTAGNYLRLYAAGRSLMLWLRTEMAWLFLVLGGQMARVGLGQAHTVGPALVFVPLGAVFATLIFFMVKMSVRGPERGASQP